MQNYSVILNKILKRISLELTTVQMKLNRINLSREDEQYRVDILRLADADVWLLASYYVEADIEKKKKFDSLLKKVMSNKKSIDEVKEQLKNMYFLKKNNLLKTSQYKLAEDEVRKFVSLLKYDKNSNIKEDEKILLIRKKNLEKLYKYFAAKSGSTSVKNIDSFKKLILDLDIKDSEKTEALMIVFVNEVSYYNSKLDSMKKSDYKFSITPDMYNKLKRQVLTKDLLNRICIDNNLDYIVITDDFYRSFDGRE